jgi:hypothetical protein
MKVRIFADDTWRGDTKRLRRMAKGAIVERGNKLYARCGQCATVVRVDKPLVGSMHLCRNSAGSK